MENKPIDQRVPIILGDLVLPGFNLDILTEDSTKARLIKDWGKYVLLFKTIETDIGLGRSLSGPGQKRVDKLLEDERFHKITKSLTKVIRWSRFIDKAGHGDQIRQHNVLQHTYSATYFAHWLAKRLQWPAEDVALLISAFECHDWGEGLLRRDIASTDKETIHDLEECQAVDHYLYSNSLSEKQADKIMRAFMLQFAIQNGQAQLKFSWRAQQQLDKIVDKQEVAWLFYFLERFGYLIYALEQYVDYDYHYMLADVLYNCLLDIKNAIAHVPGLATVLMRPHKVQYLGEVYTQLLS